MSVERSMQQVFERERKISTTLCPLSKNNMLLAWF